MSDASSNKRRQERFRELEELVKENREAVLELIDAMIVKRRVEGALGVGMRGGAAGNA